MMVYELGLDFPCPSLDFVLCCSLHVLYCTILIFVMFQKYGSSTRKRRVSSNEGFHQWVILFAKVSNSFDGLFLFSFKILSRLHLVTSISVVILMYKHGIR